MREIIDLTTPALLFPAISLLMLAYTNASSPLPGWYGNCMQSTSRNLTKILLDKFTI